MLWNAVGGDHTQNGPSHTGQPRNEGLHHVGKYVNRKCKDSAGYCESVTHHKFPAEGGLQSSHYHGCAYAVRQVWYGIYSRV